MADAKPRSEKQLAALKANAFPKGKSGNPAGKPPITEDVREASKLLTVDALDTLKDVMLNSVNPSARVNAAIAILNRGWGQPKQTMDVDVNHKQDMTSIIDMMLMLDARTEKAKAASAPIEVDHVEVKNEDHPN